VVRWPDQQSSSGQTSVKDSLTQLISFVKPKSGKIWQVADQLAIPAESGASGLKNSRPNRLCPSWVPCDLTRHGLTRQKFVMKVLDKES